MQTRTTSWKRIAAFICIAVIAMQLALLCVYLIFANSIQSSIRSTVVRYIETQANAADIGRGSTLRVDIGDIDYTYLTGLLSIREIRVTYRDTTEHRDQHLRASIPSISVSGLTLWDLLDGDGLSLGTLIISNPTITLNGISGDTPQAGTDSTASKQDTAIVELPRIPNVDSLLHDVFLSAFPSYVQPLRIDKVELVALEVTATDDNPTTLFGGNLRGVSVRFGPVRVIPGERPQGRPFGNLAIDIDSWRRDYISGKAVRTHGFHVRVSDSDSSLVVDSLLLRSPLEYDYVVKGIRFSYRSKELGISRFSIAPSMDDAAFFARQRYRGDRFRISAGPVVLRNIDFDALARGEALHVSTLDVQSLDFNLVSNVALPKHPRAARPKMLNQIVQAIPFAVSIDTIKVSNGAITYGERWTRSAVPAKLHWNKLSIVATNCRNRSENTAEPLVIKVKGLFMNHAPLEATFTIPLMSVTYQLKATGSVGKFDATTLNSFLPISDNMRIRSGLARVTTFSFTINGRTCNGMMNLRYTNLNVGKVNATTKKEGNIFDAVVSLVANWFVLRTNNDGSDFQPGPIVYTLPSNCTFMETIWLPIRDGLLESASR
ncbi:MAG: hypothetical protein FJ211_00045 [Ignavibacteria bacterium]|nr:hypothetical protein [Ignavibacteria bacterium]